MRHPGQAADLVVERVAQANEVVGAPAFIRRPRLQLPAAVAAEGRLPDQRCRRVAGEPLADCGQSEAQRQFARCRVRQIERDADPDPGAVPPAGDRSRLERGRLVAQQARRQDRQFPVAEIAGGSGPAIARRVGRQELGRQHARQRQRVTAQLVQGVAGDGGRRRLERAVDDDGCLDPAAAAGEITGQQTQVPDAVGQQPRVEGGQRQGLVDRRRATDLFGERRPVVRAYRCQQQLPAHQLGLRQIGSDRQRRGNPQWCRAARHAAQRAAPGESWGSGVGGVEHRQCVDALGAEAVTVGGRDPQFHQPGLLRGEAEAAGSVHRDAPPGFRLVSARFDRQVGDAAPGLGAGAGDHQLPRSRRQLRGGRDGDVWCVRCGSGQDAHNEAVLAACVLARPAVGDRDRQQMVADLARTRCPAQFAALAVVGGASRQVGKGRRQRLRLHHAVRIGDGNAGACRVARAVGDERYAQRVADDHGVIARDDLWAAVAVEDQYPYRLAAGRLPITGTERENEAAVVGGRIVDNLVPGLPAEVTAGGIEADPGRRRRLVQQREPDRVAVGIGRVHAESQRLPFADQLQRNGRDAWRLVAIAHLQLDVAREVRHAVAATERKAPEPGAAAVSLLRSEQVGGPGERDTVAIRRHRRAARQAVELPVQQVGVGIGRVDLDRQWDVLGRRHAQEAARIGDSRGIDADRRQLRCVVVVAHDDAQCLPADIRLRLLRQRIAAALRWQAAVADDQLDVVAALVPGGRRPAQRSLAVAQAGHQTGSGGQPVGSPVQGILIEVARPQGERERLPDDGDDLPRAVDHWRFGRTAGADDEAPAAGENLLRVTVTVVAGSDGNQVVTAVAFARGNAQPSGSLAGRAGGIGDEAREWRQAGEAEADRRAAAPRVDIVCRDRDVDAAAPVDGGGGDVVDHRRAVGVGDDDRQRQHAAQRDAGAVAVVAGGDLDGVTPRLIVVGCPDDLQRLGIEVGADGQATDAVADRRRDPCRADGGGAGLLAKGWLEVRIVGVEGEDAEAQRLPFADVQAFRLRQDRCRVGVGDVEDQLGAGAPLLAAAVGRGPGGGERQRDAIVAVLIVARGPCQVAGFRVEGCPARQPGGTVLELQRAAVRLRGAGSEARHAARELQRPRIALAQEVGGLWSELRRGMGLLDGDAEAVADDPLAVAGADPDVAPDAGLVMARCPVQQSAAGIEVRTRRQRAGQQRQVVAIGIGRTQRQRQRFSFPDDDLVGHREQRSMVAAADGKLEAAHGGATAAVLDADEDRAVGIGGRSRGPDERRDGTRPGGRAAGRSGCLQADAGGRFEQLPMEARAVAVERFDRGAPVLADAGRRQLVAVRGSGQPQQRWLVFPRRGVDPVPEVGPDDRCDAGVGGEAAGGNDADRLSGDRRSGSQLAAEIVQCVAEVDQPEIGLLAAAGNGAGDRRAEMTAGVEQQSQRAGDLVAADVGQAEVVAEFAGRPIGARVREVEAQLVAEIREGRKAALEVVRQRRVRMALDPARDLQAVVAGSQPAHVEPGGAGRRLPTDARRMLPGLAGCPGLQRQQAVVVTMEHTGGVAGFAKLHLLIEDDTDPVERQRHERAVGDRHCAHRRRTLQGDLVDAARLRNEDAAVARGDDRFTAAAAARQFQAAAAGEFDHPDAALARRTGAATGWLLARLAAGKQQPGQVAVGCRKGYAVDDAAETEF